MTVAPISVVIPALNSERFIGQAIESVYAQTLRPAEIIVVDNGCTDQTAQIAAELGAKVISEDQLGPSAARNAGIRNATRDWIALLDSDDLWDERKLECQWAAIEERPEAGMVACYFRVIENGAVIREDPPETFEQRWAGYDGRIVGKHCSYFPRLDQDFFPRFLPSCSDPLLKREVFSTVGLFDEAVEYNEDFEFFLRVLARFPLAIVEQTLISCRRHAGKRSANLQGVRDSHFAIVNHMLQHREKYPPGAPEVYRDRLKTNFLIAERALHEGRKSPQN